MTKLRNGTPTGKAHAHGIAYALVAAIALARAASAAPELALLSATGAPGDTVSVALRLSGTFAPVSGFNATVHLPANVSVTGVTRGALLPTPAFTLQAVPLTDPTVNAVAIFACSETQTIAAGGVLCSLSLAISATAGPGEYPIVIDAPDRSPIVRGSHAVAGADGTASLAHTVRDGVLTVRIAGVPGDSNGNGIPDAWELGYFGKITNVTDLTDFDHDGLSDYREYLCGTNPTDDRSCLAVTAPFERDTESGGVILRWYSVSNATYRVERARAMPVPDAFVRIGLDQLATPPMNTYIDYPPAGVDNAFYRVIRLAP